MEICAGWFEDKLADDIPGQPEVSDGARRFTQGMQHVSLMPLLPLSTFWRATSTL